MLQQAIRALLEDASLEPKYVRAALRLLSPVFSRHTSLADSLNECWQVLRAHPIQNLQLKGPRIPSLSGRTVRVCKLVDLRTFLSYYVSPGTGWYNDGDDEEAVLRLARLHSTVALAPPGRTVWVSIAEECGSHDIDGLVEDLGLIHFGVGAPLVWLEYSVSGDLLRTPTVLDAGLQPWFQPKPLGEPPRAWNWQQSNWGPIEAVHPPGIAMKDPIYRYLGRVRNVTSLDITKTVSTTIQSPSDVRAFFDGVLAQTDAHLRLQRYMANEDAILALTHRQFEHFVGDLYRREGFRTVVTRGSRDGGIDVIAHQHQASGEGVLIQAKKTRARVGISVLREIIGAREILDLKSQTPKFSQYKLVLAASAGFTREVKEAVTLSPQRYEALDYEAMCGMLRKFRNAHLRDIYFTQVSGARSAA